MEDFSLIILCKAGKKHLLPSTLDSLRSQQGAFEVLIVQDGADFASLRENYPELKIRQISVVGALPKVMNRAAREARGAYIQFLEPGDRYISQHALTFLKELIQTSPQVISDKERRFFFWKKEVCVLNESFRFCPMQDLLFRLEVAGFTPLISPRIFVDSPHDAIGSIWEHSRILYTHFGLKRALNWLFIENRPRVIQRAKTFLKKSFWREE
jgi:hypothetical protein